VITVHHLNNSRSQRVLWLLEELGLAYEIKRYERDRKTMLAPPALRAIHPLGKSPVITDGALTLAESGAIVEYLVDRYDEAGSRRGPERPSAFATLYWMHYAEGSAMPPLLLQLVLSRVARAPMPFFREADREADCRRRDAGVHRPADQVAPRLPRERVARFGGFCRQRLQRGRSAPDVSARDGGRPHRAGRGSPETDGVPRNGCMRDPHTRARSSAAANTGSLVPDPAKRRERSPGCGNATRGHAAMCTLIPDFAFGSIRATRIRA
jgi:glutathione S-transferase